MSIGLAILAGGSSSRMGQPKQLLPFKNKKLIDHVIESATGSLCQPVVLVLGAHSERILQEVAVPEQVHTVNNQEWQEGLASSLRAGIAALQKLDDRLEGVIIALCDQPFVSSAIFDQLVREFQRSGKLIVTSQYSGTFGPPALFHRSLFDQLLEISGDKGARRILEKYAADLAAVEFARGAIDLDTLDDYLALNASEQSEQTKQ